MNNRAAWNMLRRRLPPHSPADIVGSAAMVLVLLALMFVFD